MTNQERQPQQQLSEQERAARAWQYVKDVPDQADADKYGSLARRLPALLQTNGLGQTLAFLLARADDEGNRHYRLAYDHLSVWVMERMTNSQGDLLEWILSGTSDAYRQATTEAIAFSIWLRRFAEAQGWGEGAEAE